MVGPAIGVLVAILAIITCDSDPGSGAGGSGVGGSGVGGSGAGGSGAGGSGVGGDGCPLSAYASSGCSPEQEGQICHYGNDPGNECPCDAVCGGQICTCRSGSWDCLEWDDFPDGCGGVGGTGGSSGGSGGAAGAGGIGGAAGSSTGGAAGSGGSG
jgi:hypothetical protein